MKRRVVLLTVPVLVLVLFVYWSPVHEYRVSRYRSSVAAALNSAQVGMSRTEAVAGILALESVHTRVERAPSDAASDTEVFFFSYKTNMFDHFIFLIGRFGAHTFLPPYYHRVIVKFDDSDRVSGKRIFVEYD